MALYDLKIKVEKLDDGGDYRYLATSPDLPNLIVASDTEDEVFALAPRVAAALIASMKLRNYVNDDRIRLTQCSRSSR